ncbi:MAG: shikimate dehydrogenase [Weeksellaceae bacterium]|nr:shikimate dehydrogenase [Weeksellaceae bacterium]
MDHYALIGRDIQYSFSPPFFKNKFQKADIDAEYTLLDLERIEQVKPILHSGKYRGLNVTIPYKNAIIPYLDGISEEAQKMGAVNCLALTQKGYIGYNTDVYGFEESIKPLLSQSISQALILGSGGASAAVQFVLDKLNIPFLVISRNENAEHTYERLSKATVQNSQLIVNCTPLGSSAFLDSFPSIDYDAIGSNHILYDLIYTPAETVFLRKGREKGAKTKNGLEMLHLQAEKSWEIWQNTK